MIAQRLRRKGIGWLAILLTIAVTRSHPAFAGCTDSSAEKGFLAENEAAMTTMMAGMAIKPSGDVDSDFAGMMTPHHQGAVDMAKAELRYGHNALLRRIAQEIIVEQPQEIAAMRLALGHPLPPSATVQTQIGSAIQPSPTSPMAMPMGCPQ